MCGGPEKGVAPDAKVDAKTDAKNTAISKKINVSILEMEDVLFHHDSAVMMPESPVESPEDEKGSEKQEKLTGVKALALIFKQFEFDPERKIVVAGHTDSSGKAKYNFGLSELRAQNVLYLLTVDRDQWAKVSYAKHKVEDYQQIMKHAFLIRKWRCDPWKVDNKWGDKTENATREFITAYNRFEKEQSLNHPMKISDLMREIKNDGKKRWPKRLWEAVFELYCYDLCQILMVKREELKEAGQKVIKFVDEKNKYVPCGESFPIDKAQKDNYRSQTNRRVEVLVFDKDEQAVEIKCPKNDDGTPKWDSKHTKDQCPLWHDLILRPTYLSAKDLYAITYHMAFTYFNQVKIKVMNVPEGLAIKAYQDGTEKETVVTYDSSKKIYKVKVRYGKPLKELTGIKLHFEFKAPKKWVYTKNKDSDPVIFPGKDENKDIENLKKTDAYKDITKVEDLKKLRLPGSLNFYDLPAEWSSINYWTRYEDGGGKKAGERFQKAIADADKLHLKPMGSKLTKPDKPIVFSFDDIVLIDKEGRQNINDTGNAKPKDKKDDNSTTGLSENSRYSLLYVKNEDLVLYNPEDADTPYFTKCKFKENLITDVPRDGPTRLIIFANDFYSVSNKRAVKDAKFKPNKHVLGCRAACIEDPSMHVDQKVRYREYSTGRLTLAAGSPAVTGTGTTFLNNVLPGATIITDGLNVYKVKSVESNTALTLTGNAAIAEAGVGYLARTPGAEYIDYSTGTITLTNGNKVVTGSGTTFFGNVYPNAILRSASGRIYIVKSVKSNTELELTGNATASEAGVNYISKSCHYLYCAPSTGNYELHYIHDGCMISKTDKLKGLKVRSFLVIYWNGVFKGKTYPYDPAHPKKIELLPSPPAAANTPLTITAGHVKNYETKGLMNAKKRWESKPYTIEPVKPPDDGGKCKIQIKPVFFFEAKKDNLGGKPKCKVEISNDTTAGSMGITKSWMYHKDYKIRDYLKVGEFADVDSRRYKTLVVAHELSHAEGKDDEYAYITNEISSGSQNTIDKRFSQYYYGMPYSADVGSMMLDNRAPRIKQIWPFINWLNNATRENIDLKNILDETQFRVMHRFSLGGKQKQFKYYLKYDTTAAPVIDYRDIYKPFKEEAAVTAGDPGTGKVGLALYKLGEDEAALRKLKIGGANQWTNFDGVVAVFIKLGFKWDFSAGNWDDPYDATDPKSKRKWKYWFDQLVQEFKNLNSRPFYLENTADANHDFKKILIYLFPVYRDKGADGWPVPGAYYDLTLVLNNSAAATTKAGKTLNIGDKFPFRHIVNYTLGKDANTDLVLNDLKFIRDWVRSNAVLDNNNFNTKRAEA